MPAPTSSLGIGGHQSAASRTDIWLTPPELHAGLGEPESFDLDPAAAVAQPWPTARHHYTEEDNGLIQRWFGRVWLNPPYSNQLLGRFLARMAEHDHGIALIFARTETDAFHRFVWERAAACLFLRGRLTFFDAEGNRGKGNAGAPSVLCAFGHDDAGVLHDANGNGNAGLDGQFVLLALPRAFVAAVVDQTWMAVVKDALTDRGPVRLDDIYRLIAGHAKTVGRKHWRAKVRQILQRGPFTRVNRGVWRLEAG